VSIRFKVTAKNPHVLNKEEAELLTGTKEKEEDEDQILLDGVIDANFVDIDDPDDPLALCASALPSNFTREQVELLRSLAVDHLPFTIGSLAEKEMWLHEYLDQKTKLMYATPDVYAPFAWLRRAVMEDWK
jgi:hypothetical protein